LARSRLAGQEHALEVDPDHPVEVLLGKIEEIAGVDDRRVGDRAVEPAIGRHRGVDQGIHLGLVARVAGDEDRVAAGLLDRLGGLLALGHVDVGQHR
jgi:hypothetical protein